MVQSAAVTFKQFSIAIVSNVVLIMQSAVVTLKFS